MKSHPCSLSPQLLRRKLDSFCTEQPPRRARTKCNVAPPSRPYSSAVLSSFLSATLVNDPRSLPLISRRFHPPVVCIYNSHLLPAEDQTLLHGWNALLLLNALLDLLNLVVRFDVEFDLFAREGTDSEKSIISQHGFAWRWECSQFLSSLLDLHRG